MSDTRYDVFVSYAHEDGEFVASLLSRLKDENLDVFADRSITLGERWLERLEHALRQSKLVLFVLTPNSIRSNWVHIEAGAAWILDKRMIPVLMGTSIEELTELLRLRKVHELTNRAEIEALVQDLRGIFNPPRSHSAPAAPVEIFNSSPYWENLLHVGDWTRDAVNQELTGSGMHTYLLSHHEHGPSFNLTARLKIADPRPVNALDGVNAGIVLGWTTPANTRRYFNLLLTGDRMLLELIGDGGGDAYEDFVHIDEGVPFQLEEGRDYRFSIQCTRERLDLTLTVDGSRTPTTYGIALPEPLRGRVGLRPWRSTMVCSQFDVTTSR